MFRKKKKLSKLETEDLIIKQVEKGKSYLIYVPETTQEDLHRLKRVLQDVGVHGTLMNKPFHLYEEEE